MRDISKDLTVFVLISPDNPNTDDCLKTLNEQTVKFKLDKIENYHPMSAAFQEMLNRCTTPYYIQVDCDMILYSHAIETMFDFITEDENCMLCFELKDVHLNRKIFGIKIYDTKIFKSYPYENVISCEMKQLKQLENDGYSWKFVDKTLGLHSPKWNDSLIFDRYYDLMQKYNKFKYHWMKSIPSLLIKTYLTNPIKLNLFALLGAICGLITPERNREKDYTKGNEYYNKIKEFFL